MAHNLGGVQASKFGTSQKGNRDTNPIVTGKPGGLGYANPVAFKTDKQLKPKRLTYEQATGDNKAGYASMTDSEREEYRVKSMGIAPTKTDDYSDWGIARKVAADEAHSEGKMSVQDKKDQRIIDTRDMDRGKYKQKVFEQRDLEAKAAHGIAARRKAMGGSNFDKIKSKGRPSPRMTKMGPGFMNNSQGGAFGSRGISRRGAGGGGNSTIDKLQALAPSHERGMGPDFSDKERFGRPSEQRQAALAKDGWSPEEISEYGTNYMPFEALVVHSALPNVQTLTEAEASAQYGGAGKATVQSSIAIANTVMSPKYRQAAYGSGLGPSKTRSLLPYEHGGQIGAGLGGLGELGPILVDRALKGR